VHEGDRERVTLAVPGDHMVSNALAAAAVGLELGVSAGACASALAHARVTRWRMESFTTPDGVRVVNDAYNANPESMAAALRTTRWMAGSHRLIAVLGAMAELGPISEEEHEVILHEEIPAVEKRVVPRERVRLDTDTVTDQRQVAEEIRKEQVEVDDQDQLRRQDQR